MGFEAKVWLDADNHEEAKALLEGALARLQDYEAVFCELRDLWPANDSEGRQEPTEQTPGEAIDRPNGSGGSLR